MANKNLAEAKSAKNDEFYTQYADIQKEVNAYLEYDENVFHGKTVLCPCDDPEWSNFTKFFAQNFENFGLKKLISTSFAHISKRLETPWQPTLFETESPEYDAEKSPVRGKIFTLTDKDPPPRNVDKLSWKYLEGDGDFASAEIRPLRDEADFIITNPPFSLFREFLAWIVEADKKFLIIGNKNCVTYKEVFPLIKDNKMWCGKTPMGEDMLFTVPEALQKQYTENKKEGSKYRIVGGEFFARATGCWFTNIEHGRRHQPINTMTEREQIKFSRHKEVKGIGFHKYDNYDAIEVPFTDAIPSDYDGVMGVPISFLDKYCPEQFEILGTSDNGIVPDELKITDGLTQEFVDNYYRHGGTGAYKAGNPTAGLYRNGIAEMIYKRIFIKPKR